MLRFVRQFAVWVTLCALVSGCSSVEKRIAPSNFRDWRPEQSVLAQAEFQGDQVTVHNVRNCKYFANDVYMVDYYDKTIDLEHVESVDYIVVPFKGMPALAHNLSLGATSLTITPAAGFMIEAVLAFFLVTVVLSTAVAGRAGNLAPFAIGMTLTLNIIMGGALTGAAFNPARALGPMVATGIFRDAWLYLTAPIVGAIVAAILHTGLAQLAHERMAAKPDRAARTPAE